MSEPKPKASVVMVTYNHEKFIEQAVNSVLMQETDFDYEIIIGEDRSTDRTREILIELQKQHPDKIKLVLNPQNLGMIPNYVNVLNMARGEYIALLEGDDYWTSPHKLQIQVDYMEAHRECRICFHAVRTVYENDPGRSEEWRPLSRIIGDKGSISIHDWLRHPCVHTSSVVFRPTDKLPAWYQELSVTPDWPLFMWLLLNGGELRYLDTPAMSVYRRHVSGASAANILPDMERREELHLSTLKEAYWIRSNVDRTHRKYLRNRLFLHHRILVSFYLSNGAFCKARKHLIKVICYMPFASIYYYIYVSKLIVRSFPGLHGMMRYAKTRLKSREDSTLPQRS